MPCAVTPAIERFERVDSTMTVARARVSSGLSAPTLFVADEQTGGYGRQGRAWLSPVGGLWATLALPMSEQTLHTTPRGLGLRAGLGALRTIDAALEGASRPRPRLKWPNDVLVSDKKVCGVLCERVHATSGPWLLVGVGINANLDPIDLRAPLRREPTSLRALLGRDVDLDELARSLASELLQALDRPLGPAAVATACDRLWRIEKEITVHDPSSGTRTRALLRGLSEDGRLVVELGGRRFVMPESVEIVS